MMEHLYFDPNSNVANDIGYQQFMMNVNPDEIEINNKIDALINTEFRRNFDNFTSSKPKQNKIVPDLSTMNKPE